MSRIITRMTRGRITSGTTNKVLVLTVAGALYFSSPVTPPVVEADNTVVRVSRSRIFDAYHVQEMLLREDEEMLFIIKTFVKSCQL